MQDWLAHISQHALQARRCMHRCLPHATTAPFRTHWQSSLAPHEPLQAPAALHKLVQLLGSAKPAVAEVAACVLSRCCSTEQEVSTGHGGMVLQMLIMAMPIALQLHIQQYAGGTAFLPRITVHFLHSFNQIVFVTRMCLQQAAVVDAGGVTALLPMLSSQRHSTQVCCTIDQNHCMTCACGYATLQPVLPVMHGISLRHEDTNGDGDHICMVVVHWH